MPTTDARVPSSADQKQQKREGTEAKVADRRHFLCGVCPSLQGTRLIGAHYVKEFCVGNSKYI